MGTGEDDASGCTGLVRSHGGDQGLTAGERGVVMTFGVATAVLVLALMRLGLQPAFRGELQNR